MSKNWLILWKTSDFVVDTLIQTTSLSSPQKVTGQPSGIHTKPRICPQEIMYEARRNKNEELKRKIVQSRVGRLVIMLCSTLGTTDLKSPPWFRAKLHFEQEGVNVAFIPPNWGQEFVWVCHVTCQERKIALTLDSLWGSPTLDQWSGTHHFKEGPLQLQTLRHLRRFASNAQVDRNNNFPYSWSIPPSSSPDIGKSATTGCIGELGITWRFKRSSIVGS